MRTGDGILVSWTAKSQTLGGQSGTLGGVALTTALATTPEINFAQFKTGVVGIPTGSTITQLVFYGSLRNSSEQDPYTPAQQGENSPAPNFYPLMNAGGSVSLNVTAGNCYALPPDVAGLASLKIVANNAGQIELCCKP